MFLQRTENKATLIIGSISCDGRWGGGSILLDRTAASEAAVQ
jgi:hypothetical protein